ncbi:MAG: hypothetical protein ABMA64_06380 [Myxococcota bacterium]
MGEQRTIELTDAEFERTWALTRALLADDANPKRSLDVVFIAAARFVERVERGFATDGVVLETGKAGPNGPLTYLVRRRA